MKSGVLAVGKVAPEVLTAVAQGLERTFPDTTCSVVGEVLAVPTQAFDKRRRQYNSTVILNEIGFFAGGRRGFDRVLGVLDVDVYASGLTFVFGEAFAPGGTGLVSLWRLWPQFYGEASNAEVMLRRAVKEAVHELGHTLGLKHCPHSSCVMHFSNSIFEVDKKQSLFCDQCYLNAAIAIANIGQPT